MAISLLFLLLIFAPLSHSKVFVSIDCGSSESFTADNSIKWTGDDSLIKTGESHMVEDPTAVPHVMSTLRAFTTRKKNCYSVEAGKGEKVLVRASFYYGNYDKKLAPPTFELHFDGNYWTKVETETDAIAMYEVIYVVKGDETSICVAQTHPNQFPFMSGLEVRSIASTMYNHVDSNRALLTKQTVAYGASDAIRYPDDPYDRFWAPIEEGSVYTSVTSDASSIKVNVPEEPPVAVLLNAVTSKSISKPLILATHINGDEVPIYLIMHFSEVTQLDSTQNRSFVLYIDNHIASDTIIPPYGGVFELYLTNTTATQNTTFSLFATKESTLPPLINAMELFYVTDALTDGTNSKDVEGLASLQKKFSILQEWTGDPCLPFPSTWDWVNCSSDAMPRVTALYLDGFDLSGTLPDFSSMDALETIDFHNNSLTGSIPDFLGTFPNLKELNLADNKLGGSIPTSLLKNSDLNLVISGNSELCASSKTRNLCEKTDSKNSSGGPKKPSSSSTVKKSTEKLSIIVGAIILSLFVFF